MKRRSNRPSSLSESLQRQLNSYALAASAAGVGMLALAQPAEAEIVYTKIHHVIRANNRFKLDLNRDGITDFVVSDVKSGGYFAFNILRVLLPGGGPNAVVASDTFQGFFCYAQALTPGVTVGPNAGWSGNCQRDRSNPQDLLYVGAGSNGSMTTGHWNDVTNHYLGLRFVVHGKTHYGWARMSVLRAEKHRYVIKAVLTGYAYETIPNKPIVAGKTHGPDVITVQQRSLGHLARGASSH